jgi:hypothetical protein
VAVVGKTPDEVYAPFRDLRHPLISFHDCWKSTGIAGVSLFDCIRALFKAQQHKFFNYSTFDVKEYVFAQLLSFIN